MLEPWDRDGAYFNGEMIRQLLSFVEATMDQINVYGQLTTLIHFVFQVDPERIACMPKMTEFHRTDYHLNYERTNEPRAVTCPACKRTESYKQARARVA